MLVTITLIGGSSATWRRPNRPPGRRCPSSIRVKGTYLQAQYTRLRSRRGHKKALGAVKHTIIRAVWHMLTTGETYRDPPSRILERILL